MLVNDALHVRNDGAYSVLDGVLMRVGTLASAAIEVPDAPIFANGITHSLQLGRSIREATNELCNRLYDTIREIPVEDKAQRNRLIHLKRDIFNNRNVPPPELDRAVSDLPPDLRQLLITWLGMRDRMAGHEAEMEKALASLERRQRRVLQGAARNPDILKGLQTASPNFYRTLPRYLAWDGGAFDKNLRRTELALLLYLFRTTHKTSPFSRFTALVLGAFDDRPNTPMLPEINAIHLDAKVKPSMAIQARFHHAIRRSVNIFPNLRLVLHTTAAIENNRVKYYRRKEAPWEVGPIHGYVSESAYSLKLSPSLRCVYDLLVGGRSMTVTALVAMLGDRFGMSEGEAQSYVSILVENGLLVAEGLRQSVFDPHCWSRFHASILALQGQAAAQIANAVDAIRTCAERYGDADVTERERTLRESEALIERALGSINSYSGASKPLLYEDTCFARQPVLISRKSWRPLLDELAKLHGALALFDPLLISKVMLKVFFKRTFGAHGVCRDLLGFAADFHEFFYRAFATNNQGADRNDLFAQAALNPMRVPEVAEVTQAQACLRRYVLERLAEDGGAAEIILPPELVSSLGEAARRHHPFLSNAFLLQIDGYGDNQKLVLNGVLGGAGSAYSRFEDIFCGSGASPIRDLLARNALAIQPDDLLFAEFQGGYETNLNQHSLTTETEIVMPGERGLAPSARQIQFAELSLRYAEDKDLLVLNCERLGKRVVPLYLGLFHPLGLPDLQTFLLHFTSPFGLPIDHIGRALAKDKPVRHTPRLCYKNIILERAAWRVVSSELPIRDKQGGEYAFLRRLNEWREGAGVPQRSFVRVGRTMPENIEVEGEATETPSRGELRQKPFFVDFTNPFCIKMLEKQISGWSGTLDFREALPDPISSPFICNGEPHVAEFVMEITRGGP